MKKAIPSVAAALVLMGLAGVASAHTGHGTQSFFAGLEHPFGLDHLLVMVAVGVWSAVALPAGKKWWGPMAFLGALTLGATLGVAGVALPGLESWIAASVVTFGLMLAFASGMPAGAGLGVIVAAAALHGLAHGSEIPAGSTFAAYALGFLFTTATLHAGGLGLGQWLSRARPLLWKLAGACVGAAGLVMLARA